jgi:hypothetical protein
VNVKGLDFTVVLYCDFFKAMRHVEFLQVLFTHQTLQSRRRQLTC